MTVHLKPEQEEVLAAAVRCGLAQTQQDALDRALEALRERVSTARSENGSTARVALRLASFGQRHGLTLGGMTVKDLLRESRS
jgi:hypothetical protein